MKIRLSLLILLFYACGDPVDDFEGFIKPQVEFLLSGEDGKGWTLVSRTINGENADINPCEDQIQFLFIPDASNDVQPLLIDKSGQGCDSLKFCTEFPEYCIADTSICNENPGYCELLGADTLFVGFWEVQSKILESTPTDTVFIYLWDEVRTVTIDFLTAMQVNFTYESNAAEGTTIEEVFIYKNAVEQQ